MKSLVIYQSKSGYTKRYMDMLTEMVEADSIALKVANQNDWNKYESIVFAGGVYAGKISGLKKFIKMLGNHKPEQLLIVAVGASPTTELVRDKLIKDNLINDYLIKCESDKSAFFYIQGGFDPDKLNPALKFMLSMVSKRIVKKQIKSPESLTQEDKDFLNFFQDTNDHTSKEQLLPIIDILK